MHQNALAPTCYVCQSSPCAGLRTRSRTQARYRWGTFYKAASSVTCSSAPCHHLTYHHRLHREGAKTHTFRGVVGEHGWRGHQVGWMQLGLARSCRLKTKTALPQRARLPHRLHHGIQGLAGHAVLMQGGLQVVDLPPCAAQPDTNQTARSSHPLRNQ